MCRGEENREVKLFDNQLCFFYDLFHLILHFHTHVYIELCQCRRMYAIVQNGFSVKEKETEIDMCVCVFNDRNV